MNVAYFYTEAPNNLLPIVTSFVPGLPTDAAFQASIHSWHAPQITEISRTIKNSETSESCEIQFEARLFIHGTLASTKFFKEDMKWPEILNRGGKSQSFKTA